jgi:hypothetical protein
MRRELIPTSVLGGEFSWDNANRRYKCLPSVEVINIYALRNKSIANLFGEWPSTVYLMYRKDLNKVDFTVRTKPSVVFI